MALKHKYKVVKGEDGKYKLAKKTELPLNVIRPHADIPTEVLADKIKKEKQQS